MGFLAMATATAMAWQGGDPGPIDAFRANYAATKVDLDYHFRCGFAAASALARGRLWAAQELAIEEKPEMELEGHWSCDGLSEYYRRGAPAAIAGPGKKALAEVSKSGRVKLTYAPSYEGIYDGEVLTGHYFDESAFPTRSLNISPVTAAPATISNGCGPYSWWPTYPFPSLLKAEFHSITPSRGTSTRGGHALEVEVYRHDYDGFWRQLEISYDPSVGHLPRYARLVEAGGPAANVREYYLIDARPCTSGGFVPTEWYATALAFDRFASDYPSYSHETVLDPGRSSFVGHFKATSFADRSRPVALERLAEVTVVNAPGGQVSLGNNPRSLTLADVKSAVGTRLMGSSGPSLPTLDSTELNEFEREPRGPWPVYLAGLIGVVVAALAVRHRRRAISAAPLLLLAVAAGCGKIGEPVARLSASFQESPRLYDLRDPTLPTRLIVRNDGNVPLHLIKGDGGCSCREVDRASFPLDLKPGQKVAVPVKISHGRMSTPQTLPFTFETDRGVIGSAASLHALPRHQLSPESPSAMLVEGDSGWTIELVHRSIARDGEPDDAVELVVPPEFASVTVSAPQ